MKTIRIALALCLSLCLMLTCSAASFAELTYTGDAPIFDEPFTISWLCTNTTNFEYNFDEMRLCQKILEKANVKLDIEVLDASVYEDVLSTRLAAGINLPDVVMLPAMDLNQTYISAGIFADLSDAYEKYGYNLKKVFSCDEYKNVESMLRTPDGGLYYVPMLSFAQVAGLDMNYDWVEKTGLPIPKTTDELYEVLSAMKKVDYNGNGKDDEIPLFLRPGWINYLAISWGIDLVSGFTVQEDGTVKCSFTDPRYLDFLTYFNRLYKEGLLYNEYVTSTFDIQKTLFANKQVGSIYFYSSNSISYNLHTDPDFDQETEPFYKPVDTLIGPYGDQYWIAPDPVSCVFAITSSCKNVDEVFCFLDYLFSDYANELLINGEEGIDFIFNEDGTVKQIGDSLDETGAAARAGHLFGGFPRRRNDVHTVERTLTGKRVFEIIDRQMPYIYNSTVGHNYTTPEQAEIINMYLTDLQTYWEEMMTAFIIGTVPLDTFDDYVKNVESYHLSDILAVYQAQQDSRK